MTARRIVIIGGGFAGLAAGVGLSERGAKVVVCERRGHLGGRAYSFTDQQTGDVVDNGQHLFMGCYHHTIAFLEKIGCLDRLTFQDSPRVDFLDRDQGYTSFECPRLPAPLHAVAGLLRMRGITVGDKLRVARVGRAIRRNGRAGAGALTVKEWLASLGQSERIRERFWYPLAIATLNEDPQVASARMLEVVLKKVFGEGRRASSIGIARVGLSELYTDGATAYIESRGGEVRTSATVERLVIEGKRVVAVEMKDGERIEADAVISAVPHTAFLKMLPQEWRGEFAAIEKLRAAPIVSINLWFDRNVFDRQFVGLIGTRSQWLFNKNLIVKPTEASNQIAVIISAAHAFVDWTKEQLVEMALGELRELLPETRAARLLHSRIVKEREATLSHTTASDGLRPGPRTAIENLILAGGWTATGLPDTIESAVLSGHTAAEIAVSKGAV